jgi:hypothetical protein
MNLQLVMQSARMGLSPPKRTDLSARDEPSSTSGRFTAWLELDTVRAILSGIILACLLALILVGGHSPQWRPAWSQPPSADETHQRRGVF